MKIIYMGTPEFAVPALKTLVESGYDIVGVVTATDKYGGRGGKQLIESDVKKYAVSAGLHILQPKNLKDPKFVEEVRALGADLQIVVAFRMLPVVIWDMPKHGTYNLHGSLLPRFRGAAPIHWAVMTGAEETGVTSFKLKHEIDTGDVLYQERIHIRHEDTTGVIYDKLMHLGAAVVLKTVKAVESGTVHLMPQDNTKVSKAPKIYHETCEIDFSGSVAEVYDHIRGLNPWPMAWTTIDGLEWKILMSGISDEALHPSHQPGHIVTDNKRYIKIACSDGYVALLDVKMQGKKRMDIKSLLNGYDVQSENIG